MYPTYIADTNTVMRGATGRYLRPKSLSYLLTLELRKRFWEKKEVEPSGYRLDYVEIHNAALIAGRPVLKADAYEIEEMLDRSLSYTILSGDQLKFGIDMRSYALSTAQVLQALDIAGPWRSELARKLHLTYNAAHMVRYGYVIQEEKGKYLVVTSRHGVRHYTTGSCCSCHEGLDECGHMLLALHCLEHRDLWKRIIRL